MTCGVVYEAYNETGYSYPNFQSDSNPVFVNRRSAMRCMQSRLAGGKQIVAVYYNHPITFSF